MTRTELLELIANGANSGVEFMRDDLRAESLAKKITALANSRGGHILLGVENDGTVSGIRRDNLEHWVMDAVFGRKVYPPILPFYAEIPVDERRSVAVIDIGEGANKPYAVRRGGREDIYVRVGSTSQLATREQQVRLFALGGLPRAESLPAPGSGLRDLSRERLEDYLTVIVGEREAPASERAWIERLCGLGFMVERSDGPPACTIAGLALFGYRPRRLLRQAGVRWMAFEGSEKTYRALDDRVVDGPLVALWQGISGGGRTIVEKGLIELLLNFMTPFVSEDGENLVEGAMRRERSWRYPPEALREAVVNALAHRDWTRYEEVEIVSYADRLEVLSPGALQNSMTVEKMVAGQRSTRNSLIVDVLRDYGYVDARGMGVRKKIIPLMRTGNGVDPKFEATENYLRLTLRRGARAES